MFEKGKNNPLFVTIKLYRYRWFIGAALLVAAVVFELSGSSIGMWNKFIHDSSLESDGVLFGVNRAVRSDEWAVFTPMALSQYKNRFQQFGDAFRGIPTDMFIVYGQPIRDWSMIFRPFQLGYLVLDSAKGLAFYWFGKLIVLLLVSSEFGMLITRKNKQLSIAYAMLVTFAPVVQWWFSTNAFPDMLVYGQAIVLLVCNYMTTKSYLKRITCAFGLFVCCGAYLLVLYPAWQVPFFYVFLFIGIWCIRENYQSFSFSPKMDISILVTTLILLIVCMLGIAIRSKDSIYAILHSDFPGARLEKGGGMLNHLFRYPGNLFMPFVSGVPVNECEMASFWDMFPLGLLFSVNLYNKQGARDVLTKYLWVLALFLGLYTVFGFPKIISQILLLSSSQASRAFDALSFVNLLLLIRSLALYDYVDVRINSRYFWLGLFLLASTVTYYSFRLIYSTYFTKRMFVICAVVLTLSFLSALADKHWFCYVSCLLSLLIGGTVNPVRSGLDVIEQHRLGQVIRTISAEDKGKWMAVSDTWIAGNFLAMNGAPTVNSTNIYANRELWDYLDSEKTHQEIWNRYAHITVDLSSTEPTKIELLSADLVHILLHTTDLKRLGIRYIMSPADLSLYSNDSVSFDTVFSLPEIAQKIYHIEYTKREINFVD